MFKKLMLITLISIGVFVTGCSTQNLDSKNEEMLKSMNTEEFQFFFSNFISEERPIQELEIMVEESIKFHPDEAIDIIDAYVYNLSLSVPKYRQTIVINKEAFDKETWINGLIVSEPKSAIVRGLIEELSSRHLKLKKVVDEYMIFVDYSYIVAKYGKHLDPEVRNFYKFFAELNEYEMFTREGINSDLLVKHITDSQLFLLTGTHQHVINNSLNRYTTLLAYFIESLGDPTFQDSDGVVHKDRVESLEKFSRDNRNNPLTPYIDRVLVRLEENEGKTGEGYETFVMNLLEDHLVKMMAPKFELEDVEDQSSLQTFLQTYKGEVSIKD